MSTRAKPWSSTAFRLALQFAGLMVLTMAIVLSVFYVQTVGVLRARVDRQAEAHLKRLVEHSGKYGQEALEAEITGRQASCVLVSHDRSFVRTVGTRFWLIDKRRLVEVEDAEAFFASA